jgi:VCBS repeat-containing protein
LGFGHAATLEWDRNPETNVIGYRVYVGRVSRSYDSVLDIGNQTSAEVPTSPGRTYFAVTAYDSDGLESDYSEEVFYTLLGDNTAPSALGDNYVAAKNTALNVSFTLGVLANDWDAEGNALTATLSSGPIHGTATLNSDGSFSYSPAISFIGADSFTYQASDGIAVSEVTTVNVTVNDTPNRGPVPQADNYTTPKNTPLSISAVAGILANDTDPDGDVLIADLQASPFHGTVILSVDGSFLYTPAVGFTGVDSFTYIAFDGIELSPATLATINVTGINSAPTAQPDAYATVKNTPLNVTAALGVLANDNDLDGEPLTAALVNLPSHGSVTLNANGSFLYTPTTSYTGTDTFRYRANDGAANSATVTVTITITPPPNSVPVAASDNYSMAKNTTLNVTAGGGVLANDTDADGNNLTALLVVSPTHGTLTLNANGGFNYTPAAGYSGTDNFGYRARDSVTNSTTAIVVITILNNLPVARANTYTVTKNTTLNVNTASGVLANDTDSDGDALTAALVSSPANGTLSLNPNGSFLYTPTSGYNGSDGFVYRASDGSATSNATVTITINNTAPSALADSYSASKNISFTIAVSSGVLANDADANGDSLTAALVTAPAHGIAALNANGSFVYTPAANYTGNDSFVYRASDGSATANATVTFTIANNAPAAQVDGYVTSMNTALSAAAPGVLANDTDANGDSLTATLINSPTHGSLTLNANGSFLYTPTAGFTGTDTFGYRANDGSAVSATALVTLTVNAVPRTNSPPTPQPDTYSTTRNAPLNVPSSSGVLMNDTDVDGNTLTATLLTSPAHGTVTLNPSGGLSYAPATGFVGLDSFQYLAGDGAASASATVSITVDEEWKNSPPAGQPDEYVTSENTPLTVPWASRLVANDIDVDGDTLTVIQVDFPSHGNVTLNPNGTLVYTPAAGFYGVDHFDYAAFDGTDYSESTTVTITVTEQPDSTNSAPKAEPENYFTSKNSQLNVPATSGLLLNDSDAEDDPLTAMLLISTTYGTLVLNPDGSFVYTPNANFTGTDSFVYQASDGTSGSPTRRVTVTVLAGPPSPTACTPCFAGLDEVLASRSNAFAAVIAARRSVPMNATCPRYHVLVFQTLSRSLVTFHDPAADHALSLAADCVVSELQDEVNARLAYTATLAPSKFTTQASNYLNLARQNLGFVHGAADNVARAKYFAGVVSAFLRVEKAIASGDLAPASLAGKSLTCLLKDGGPLFQATFSFSNGSFVFADAAGVPLGTGTYTFTRTAYNAASLNLHFDTYAPGESTSFVMKFSRARNSMTGSRMRGSFTVQ